MILGQENFWAEWVQLGQAIGVVGGIVVIAMRVGRRDQQITEKFSTAESKLADVDKRIEGLVNITHELARADAQRCEQLMEIRRVLDELRSKPVRGGGGAGGGRR